MPAIRTTYAETPAPAVVKPLGNLADPFRQIYLSRHIPRLRSPYTIKDPNARPKDPRPPPLALRDLECQRVLGKSLNQVILVKNTRRSHPMDIPASFALKAIRRKTVRHDAIVAHSQPLTDDSSAHDRRQWKQRIAKHHFILNRERKVLSLLDFSPFITGLVDTFYDSQALYMALEYIPGPTLRSVLRASEGKPLKASVASFFLANVLCALDHIREQGVVHRDVRPENIIVGPDGYLVLTDFGDAVHGHEADADWNQAEAHYYMAPEANIQSKYAPQDAPYALDIWSTGCILFEMITGKLALYEEDPISIYEVSMKRVKWPEGVKVGRHAKDLAEKMLIIDAPSDRIGANEIDDVFSHPWLEAIDKTKVREKKYLAPYLPEDVDASETWHTAPLPKQSHFPGLNIREPSILLAHDDRFPPHPDILLY